MDFCLLEMMAKSWLDLQELVVHWCHQPPLPKPVSSEGLCVFNVNGLAVCHEAGMLVGHRLWRGCDRTRQLLWHGCDRTRMWSRLNTLAKPAEQASDIWHLPYAFGYLLSSPAPLEHKFECHFTGTYICFTSSILYVHTHIRVHYKHNHN